MAALRATKHKGAVYVYKKLKYRSARPQTYYNKKDTPLGGSDIAVAAQESAGKGIQEISVQF